MSPNLIRRELLRDHLMLNEDITLFDDERVIGNKSIYDEDAQQKNSWDDEILDHKLDDFFANELTFHEWEENQEDTFLEFL